MKQLQPIDIIVDLDVPDSGFHTDEHMTPPVWDIGDVASMFFGRSRDWFIQHSFAGHLVLDGEPVVIPRRLTTDYRVCRLIDIERIAHALAQNGYLDIRQLIRVIEMVRLVAETWGYLPERDVVTRIERHDPTREDKVYVMSERDELTDDIDGTAGATARTFALGDVEYSLDLSDEHWHDLVSALAPYTKVARRDLTREPDRRRRRDERHQVRVWARNNGYVVSEHGPISRTVMNAYLTRRGA